MGLYKQKPSEPAMYIIQHAVNRKTGINCQVVYITSELCIPVDLATYTAMNTITPDQVLMSMY